MIRMPEKYIELMKNLTLEELLKERDELIERMHDFEKREIDYMEDRYPSPYDVYSYEFLYLSELCKLIYERLYD